MELAKSGDIGKICVPNALATFREYLNDFASAETKAEAEIFLKAEIDKLAAGIKKKAEKMVERVDNGERDVFL